MEAPKKGPCPSACGSPWRQPSLLGDVTFAVVARPRWAYTQSVAIDMCSNKDAGRSESRPRPLVNVNKPTREVHVC